MTSTTATFSITGAPEKAATLNVAGPLAPNEEASLFMAGPPDAFGTLGIGRDQFASGDASLVILGDISTDGGNDSIQATVPVFVKGTLADPKNATLGLIMKSQPFASGVGDGVVHFHHLKGCRKVADDHEESDAPLERGDGLPHEAVPGGEDRL